MSSPRNKQERINACCRRGVKTQNDADADADVDADADAGGR